MVKPDYEKMYYEALRAAGIGNMHEHEDVLVYMRQKYEDQRLLNELRRSIHVLSNKAEGGSW